MGDRAVFDRGVRKDGEGRHAPGRVVWSSDVASGRPFAMLESTAQIQPSHFGIGRHRACGSTLGHGVPSAGGASDRFHDIQGTGMETNVADASRAA